MPKTAEVIVSLRKKNGITQEKLAEMLLVSRSLVSLWELGRRMPDYSNVLRMASIFDTKLLKKYFPEEVRLKMTFTNEEYEKLEDMVDVRACEYLNVNYVFDYFENN